MTEETVIATFPLEIKIYDFNEIGSAARRDRVFVVTAPQRVDKAVTGWGESFTGPHLARRRLKIGALK